MDESKSLQLSVIRRDERGYVSGRKDWPLSLHMQPCIVLWPNYLPCQVRYRIPSGNLYFVGFMLLHSLFYSVSLLYYAFNIPNETKRKIPSDVALQSSAVFFDMPIT